LTEPVRILIADDQVLLRGSLRVLIDTAEGFEVAGEAGDGAQAVDLASRTEPDVILMDVRMPVMDGIEATRLVCATMPATRVLILTTFDLDSYVYAALRAGASGFLLKDTAPADLLAAVRVVAAGEALLALTSTSSRTANAKCSPSSPGACPTPSSPRTSASAWPP
jgi:DNA-binding NarL/FixJ family response regulator